MSMTGELVVSCSAETEPTMFPDRVFLLFKCPEEWLPVDQAEFLEAAKYHGHDFVADGIKAENVLWAGYVPF